MVVGQKRQRLLQQTLQELILKIPFFLSHLTDPVVLMVLL